MKDDILTRVVVDVQGRKFYLYSDQGNERLVECQTLEEFMNVLKVCRDTLDEDTLAYATLP